mmetsp:Transcript_12127/g.28007  ORF Transcript_12127/g.28007 Transcript_12127/m.28007 type:complete len:230 (-) Transcript_12127:726-1415(-)
MVPRKQFPILYVLSALSAKVNLTGNFDRHVLDAFSLSSTSHHWEHSHLDQSHLHQRHDTLPSSSNDLKQPVPHILQLLGHFSRRSVKIFGNLLLSRWAQVVESFAKVSVHHILDREVVGPEGKLVSSADARVIVPFSRRLVLPCSSSSSEMHLKVEEEVHILAADKRLQRTDASVHRPIDDGVGATGRQGRLLQAADCLSDMILNDLFRLVVRPLQIVAFEHSNGPRLF